MGVYNTKPRNPEGRYPNSKCTKTLSNTWSPQQKTFGDEIQFKISWKWPYTMKLADGRTIEFTSYTQFSKFISTLLDWKS